MSEPKDPHFRTDYRFNSQKNMDRYSITKDAPGIVEYAEQIAINVSRKLDALAELFDVIASTTSGPNLDSERLGGMCELLEDASRDLKLSYDALQNVYNLEMKRHEL